MEIAPVETAALEPKYPSSRFVPLVLGVAVVAVSFAAIFFRKAMPTHPLVMAGLRLGTAAAVLAPWTVRSILKGRMRGRMLAYAVAAGLLYGIHFGVWVTSLSLTGIAASVTLVTTTPLILALAGWITGRDRPDRKLWIALLLAAAGLFLIGGGDFVSSSRLAGDALALAGAVAVAGYFYVGRALGHDLDVPAFSGVATAVGSVALLGTAWVFGIPIRAASGEALVYILLAALIPQLIGHNLLTWCLRHAKPSTVGMAVVGEPVGATFLAWIWWKEDITSVTALGCVVLLAGVVTALAGRSDAKL